MSEWPTVADYVARRLAREGITNSFAMPCTGMVSASGNDAGPSGRAPSPFCFQNHSTYHRLEGPDGR